MSFAAEVWTKLSAIDVSAHVEKKQNLSYLSWGWAWNYLMSTYPESQYWFDEPCVFPDGSVEIRVTVVVNEGEKSLTRTMWLPVMDNKMNAVTEPDARDISDTKMRCLVKCLSMFGLGHHLYLGEDAPKQAIEETISESQMEWAVQALTDTDSNLAAFGQWLQRNVGVDKLHLIPASKWESVEAVLLKKLDDFARDYAKSAEVKGE